MHILINGSSNNVGNSDQGKVTNERVKHKEVIFTCVSFGASHRPREIPLLNCLVPPRQSAQHGMGGSECAGSENEAVKLVQFTHFVFRPLFYGLR